MDLNSMFKKMEATGFKSTKLVDIWLKNGRYGVKITKMELDRTSPNPESGKEPQDYVKFNLEVVEPEEYAGKIETLKFYPNSKGKKNFGPDKDMSYLLWSFVDTIIILWQAGYFRLPTSVLSDEQELIKVLTTESNKTITDKVFYIEKTPQRNSNYSNVDFIGLEKEEVGKLGAFPEEIEKVEPFTVEEIEAIAIEEYIEPVKTVEEASDEGNNEDWLSF